MYELGNAIRNIRKQRSITLDELADKAGLSASFISKIERGINSPSFNNLQKICQALGVSSTELVSLYEPQPQEETASSIVIRKSERNLVYDYSDVVRFESIGTHSPLFSVDVMTIRGSREEYSAMRHKYDEFGIVTAGTLLVKMKNEEHRLEEGDCILIKAGVMHRVQKDCKEDCISYWVVCSQDADR